MKGRRCAKPTIELVQTGPSLIFEIQRNGCIPTKTVKRPSLKISQNCKIPNDFHAFGVKKEDSICFQLSKYANFHIYVSSYFDKICYVQKVKGQGSRSLSEICIFFPKIFISMMNGNSPATRNSCQGQCSILGYKLGQDLHFDLNLGNADCMVKLIQYATSAISV